ncbi:MAG: VIT1/CCC1 transporter family protein, partial [Actinobacteria bacterium]|nr:VIT1/CCC1 transporter family protein [Actinomycetota bacterium]
KELELIYRAKGLSREQAGMVAAQIMTDPKIALETLAREELGLDPNELGNPIKVAISSFISFAIGASVVVLPYLFFTGPTASTSIPLLLAVSLSLISMIIVGSVVGRLSGRGMIFSAARQLAWGVGAAVVTYGVGRIIGVNIG